MVYILNVFNSDIWNTFADVFKHDPDYEANEEKYQAVKTEIIGSGSDSGETDESDESNDESSSDEEAKGLITYLTFVFWFQNFFK